MEALMSFETIKIYRDYQIIDGFVRVPPNLESDRTTYTPNAVIAEIPTAFIYNLNSIGSGADTGSSFGQPSTIRFEVVY